MNIENFKIPIDEKRVSISKSLLNEIRKRFKEDRHNRFQLFLLSSGVRNKYLIQDRYENRSTYSDEFVEWYEQNKLSEYYGQLSNFTKYASCGDVIHYLACNSNEPKKYLDNLPLSMNSLYEISQILKMSEDVFNICLHFTPTRKSIDQPRYEWRTIKPALINRDQTEMKLKLWRKFWNDPKQVSISKDWYPVPLITISCSNELFDFDDQTGEKIGSLNIEEVEYLSQKLSEVFEQEIRKLRPTSDQISFKIENNISVLTEQYEKKKEQSDPARELLKVS